MKDAVTNAKNSWIEEKCKLLNESVQRGTKDSWELLGKLKSDLDRSKTVNSTKMKKPDGSLCETPEENAEVFRHHFENLYSTIPNTDESVLEHVEAVLIPPALDALPDNEEIRKAIQSLHNTAPGNSGLPAQLWKALQETEETFNVF